MGIVYMIYFEKLAYVGSTIKSLNARMSGHKTSYKGWQEDKYDYCSSFEIIQHDGYEAMVIEEIKNETEYDLRCRERFWIDWYGKDNLVNKYKPQVTREDNAANRDEHNRKVREYHAANRDERNRKKKEYRAANRDEINRKRRERRSARKAKSD